MQSSKTNTFLRTSYPSGKKANFFDPQILQDLAREISTRPRATNKIRQEGAYKPAETLKKASSCKQKLKQKPTRPLSSKKQKKVMRPTNEGIGLKYLQAIANSQTYKALRLQYLQLKNQQYCTRRQIRRQVSLLQKEVRAREAKGKEVIRMRDNLIGEVNLLSGMYEELRLHNYELACEVNARRGYEQRGYYDSVPNIEQSQLEYEDMLQLEEQIGNVEIGYPQTVIQNMSPTYFRAESGEEKCCICCGEFEEGEAIYTTQCRHTHHLQCLQKWLKIKRICPLCRQPVQL